MTQCGGATLRNNSYRRLQVLRHTRIEAVEKSIRRFPDTCRVAGLSPLEARVVMAAAAEEGRTGKEGEGEVKE